MTKLSQLSMSNFVSSISEGEKQELQQLAEEVRQMGSVN